MTSATFMTRDIQRASNETSTRMHQWDGDKHKRDLDRVVLLLRISTAAMHHGEPTMSVSPEDFTLIADAFYDWKKGKLDTPEAKVESLKL